MTRLDDLEAQKDKLLVHQAYEKANLNNKIRTEKSRQKREKEKKKEQRDAAYKDFKTKTEGKETQNLIKKLKRILEEIEIEWQKIIRK